MEPRRQDRFRGPRWPRGGCAALAVVAAPFIAFAYHPNAGLAMAAVALLTVAWLAPQAPAPDARAGRRLRLLAAVNAALAVACLGLLLLRLVGG